MSVAARMLKWLPAALALVTTTSPARADGQWKLVPLPRSLPNNYAVTSLADGRVMIAGGSYDGVGPTNAVSIFDPKTDTWSDAAPMSATRTSSPPIAALATGELRTAGARQILLAVSVRSGRRLQDEVRERC